MMDYLRSLLPVRPISEKCTVQVISILSMVTCLATIITYLIILRDPQAWEGVGDYVLHWMVDNNLDVTVSKSYHKAGKGKQVELQRFPKFNSDEALLQSTWNLGNN